MKKQRKPKAAKVTGKPARTKRVKITGPASKAKELKGSANVGNIHLGLPAGLIT